MELINLLKIRIHNCMLSKCPLSLQVPVEDSPSCPHAASRFHSLLFFPPLSQARILHFFLPPHLHSLLHTSRFPTVLTGPPSLRLWLCPPTSPKLLISFPCCMPAWRNFSVMVSRPVFPSMSHIASFACLLFAWSSFNVTFSFLPFQYFTYFSLLDR